MIIPRKFFEWQKVMIFRPGVKIRACHMYRDFVQSCNGSFRHLSRSVFYDWVRISFKELEEGKDARGLWFVIGQRQDDNESISRAFLSRYTCDEFMAWFDSKFDSLVYSRFSTSDMRADFIKSFEFSEYLVTKQKFNRWLELATKYKGFVLEKGRDARGVYAIIK